MGGDTRIVLLIAGLHVIALACAGVLVYLCLRDESVPPWRTPGDESDDGGGNDRLRPRPPTGPRGGSRLPIPLPDAVPARVRLRGHERLSDLRDRRGRRPAREPTRPRRVPARHG